MTYATGLVDGVGARLMGSPNMRRAYDWSLARLGDLGLSDPRLEPIGPFGLSWRPSPRLGPDHLARRRPGPGRGQSLVGGDEGTDRGRGGRRAPGHRRGPGARQGGGWPARSCCWAPKAASAEPAVVRYTDAEVLKGDAAEAVRAYYRTVADRRARQGREGLFKARRNAFLAAEGVAAVVLGAGGAQPGVMVVDGSELGGRPWLAAERPAFPALCLAGEAYARCWRLAQAGVRVRVQLEIATEEGDPAEPGYNVVAGSPAGIRR